MSAIACAAALASCGGSEEDEGTIPTQTGENILTKLDDVEQQFDAGECDAAEASALQIQAAIAGLNSVKGNLEEALVEASGNLVTLVREDCEPADEEKEPPEPPSGATGEEGTVP